LKPYEIFTRFPQVWLAVVVMQNSYCPYQNCWYRIFGVLKWAYPSLPFTSPALESPKSHDQGWRVQLQQGTYMYLTGSVYRLECFPTAIQKASSCYCFHISSKCETAVPSHSETGGHLLFYCQLKNTPASEPYTNSISTNKRHSITMLRCGCLPLGQTDPPPPTPLSPPPTPLSPPPTPFPSPWPFPSTNFNSVTLFLLYYIPLYCYVLHRLIGLRWHAVCGRGETQKFILFIHSLYHVSDVLLIRVWACISQWTIAH